MCQTVYLIEFKEFDENRILVNSNISKVFADKQKALDHLTGIANSGKDWPDDDPYPFSYKRPRPDHVIVYLGHEWATRWCKYSYTMLEEKVI